ncbi:MAG: molybdopterin molybdotransferase MoeA [Clostridiales Family XIII bacterium]|jgi:molybdopterin molybdotransferase|nr:molybdopterin molybdotransferase MoeA [Clostridiales Family XIII bacterium]
MLNEIEVEEAQKLLLDLPVKLDTEPVPIGDALGRVAAEAVRADIPFPPFDRSPFDGYAFRGEDTAPASRETPVTLKIWQEIPAGHMPMGAVTEGKAAKILTGAPIPPGADAVVKFEDTEFTEGDVALFAPVAPGVNIVRAGEDIPAGTVILMQGAPIEPADMGLLAAQGLKSVKVFRRPLISVINTGSELAELGRPLPPGMIYNSSMFTLQGFLAKMGAGFRDGGIVNDDESAIAARVRAELATADMVITTGGASVGDYDCAKGAAERAGADILFWKIRMRPGGSMLAYTLGGKPVLALSGNPGAAVLGLLLIGLPCIKKHCGLADLRPETCTVRLASGMKKSSPKRRIVRGHLKIEDGEAFFAENTGQGGGDISSLVNCDLLADIPAGSPPLEAGARVKAYRVFQ